MIFILYNLLGGSHEKIFVALLASALILGSLHTPVSNALENDQTKADKIGYIDERLPKKDKLKLKEIMETLDPEDRENVYYFDIDGSFTANKMELLDEYKRINKDIIDKDGKLKKNEEFAAISTSITEKPKDEQVEVLAYTNPSASCVSANSGPYRKVTSTQGLTRLTTNLYLPVKGTEIVINKYPNEAAYMYSGAINNSNGQQVDVGLMLNWGDGVNPVTSTEETWAMTSLGTTTQTGTIGNYKMGQTVFMKFYVSASNQVALNVEGYKKDNSFLSATAVYGVDPSKGFTVGGSTMSVKRITSVAQDFTPGAGTSENLTTGSSLYNVVWSNVKVGVASGSEQLQNASTTSTSCGYKTSNVLVDFTSYSQESIKVKAGTLTP